MKKLIYISTLIISLALNISCGREIESTKVQPKRVESLIQDNEMTFVYNLEAGQVEEYGKGIGKILLFGPVLKRLAWMLAGLSLSGSNGKAIELESQVLDISSLKNADSKYIKEITIDRITLRIKDAKSNNSLQPFSKIEMYIDKSPNFNLPADEQGRYMLLSFDKKRDEYGCGGQCLDLKVSNLNFKNVLFNSNVNEVLLIPRFVINSVPTDTFELAGEVVFSIKFNPGF